MLSNTDSILRDGLVSAQGPTASFTYDSLLQGLVPANTKDFGQAQHLTTQIQPSMPQRYYRLKIFPAADFKIFLSR